MPNPSVKSEQGSDLAPYLGHWIQSEKLSKIKLPLIHCEKNCSKIVAVSKF